MDADGLIRDYLGRLDAASWTVPAPRRAELAEEVREHIETALAEAGSRDEVTVRNVLERLGRPEEIAAADADPAAGTPSPQARGTSWGAVEILAILFLTVGAVFLPIIGPLIGLAFTWVSHQWTAREKAIATLIGLVLVAIPFVGLALYAAGGTAGPSGVIS